MDLDLLLIIIFIIIPIIMICSIIDHIMLRIFKYRASSLYKKGELPDDVYTKLFHKKPHKTTPALNNQADDTKTTQMPPANYNADSIKATQIDQIDPQLLRQIEDDIKKQFDASLRKQIEADLRAQFEFIPKNNEITISNENADKLYNMPIDNQLDAPKQDIRSENACKCIENTDNIQVNEQHDAQNQIIQADDEHQSAALPTSLNNHVEAKSTTNTNLLAPSAEMPLQQPVPQTDTLAQQTQNHETQTNEPANDLDVSDADAPQAGFLPIPVMLALGVVLITTAAIAFIFSIWNDVSAAGRLASIASLSVIFFIAFALAHFKLKISNSAKAFYILGISTLASTCIAAEQMELLLPNASACIKLMPPTLAMFAGLFIGQYIFKHSRLFFATSLSFVTLFLAELSISVFGTELMFFFIPAITTLAAAFVLTFLKEETRQKYTPITHCFLVTSAVLSFIPSLILDKPIHYWTTLSAMILGAIYVHLQMYRSGKTAYHLLHPVIAAWCIFYAVKLLKHQELLSDISALRLAIMVFATGLCVFDLVKCIKRDVPLHKSIAAAKLYAISFWLVITMCIIFDVSESNAWLCTCALGTLGAALTIWEQKRYHNAEIRPYQFVLLEGSNLLLIISAILSLLDTSSSSRETLILGACLLVAGICSSWSVTQYQRLGNPLLGIIPALAVFSGYTLISNSVVKLTPMPEFLAYVFAALAMGATAFILGRGLRGYTHLRASLILPALLLLYINFSPMEDLAHLAGIVILGLTPVQCLKDKGESFHDKILLTSAFSLVASALSIKIATLSQAAWLPTLIRPELILLMLAGTAYGLAAKVWKFQGLSHNIAFGITSTCMTFLYILVEQDLIFHACITSVLALIAIFAAIKTKYRRYLALGVVNIAIIFFSQTKSFWENLHWWVYLAIIGATLLTTAVINENERRRGSNLKKRVKALINETDAWKW